MQTGAGDDQTAAFPGAPGGSTDTGSTSVNSGSSPTLAPQGSTGDASCHMASNPNVTIATNTPVNI